MYGQMEGWTDGWTDRLTNRQMDGQTCRWTDGGDGQIDGHRDIQMYGRLKIYSHWFLLGWTEGSTYGQKYAGMYGWTDGQT